MSPFSLTSSRLPGIRGFLRRNPVFNHVPRGKVPTRPELVEAAEKAVREGRCCPGDRFPNPGEIAQTTGASLVESLEAVSSLLRKKVICQTSSGRLFICPNRKV